ncbi:MAG TPA: hypothetical protein VMM92_13270 [Thermoanaerobaculia bacterium]|nr:hypothetical protein [Thermoanaerobaculia bacterium]
MRLVYSGFCGISAALALLVLSASPAAACSICRCGDPTFNALGTQVYASGEHWNFRVALDWERFEKEQGSFEPAAAAAPTSAANTANADRAAFGRSLRQISRADSADSGRESQVENRFTTTLSYVFAERVNLVGRIPWTSRRLTAEDGVETSHDLADPEIYGLVRLWASNFAPGLGRRAWVSAIGGVKTNWGKNDLAVDGTRLDEHLQAGTGSTDTFGGLSAFYLLDSHSSLFGSAQVRRTGSNDFGYRYGNTTLANIGYEHRLGEKFDTVVEVNYRNAGRDQIDDSGLLDPNTGGNMFYVTPHLSWDFGKGVVGRMSVQIPVVRNLHGDQEEKAVANIGLTYLF